MKLQLHPQLPPAPRPAGAAPRFSDDEIVAQLQPHYWPGMQVADAAAVLVAKRIGYGDTTGDLPGWLARLAEQAKDAAALFFMLGVWLVAYCIACPANAAGYLDHTEIGLRELVELAIWYLGATIIFVAIVSPRRRRS